MMRRCVVALLLVVLLSSCDSNVVWSDSEAISEGWNKDDVLIFQVPQLDTVQPYNVFINVRNSNDYPFNNLFLVASIQYPHGKIITDTLEYKMAYPDGQWMGAGVGSIKENKLWFKENIRFSESGNYNITITQAVRNIGEVDGVSQLPGITDVGISIEEVTQEP
ncbi:MAG: gliding motility lipoprotein GldH [Marinirhabdus sp.]|nr:gliding motility lipoprotein GldH [Marinirhabdus sp.]